MPADRIDALPDLKPGDLPQHLAHFSRAQLVELLKEPMWRLSNLYWVIDKNGKVVLFVPNEVQAKFYREMWYRNIVPKARQRGYSTAIQLLALDTCHFSENFPAAVIAQDRDTAGRIFDSKVKFAYDHLPKVIQQLNPIREKTKSSLTWDSGSELEVATSVRGGTMQFLHVSELGKIARDFPLKAQEIQSGSLPAVPETGIIVIESTVEAPEGTFADMVRRAEQRQQLGRSLTRHDYRLHFASWWDADEYEADPDNVVISSTDHAYFERVEAAVGRSLSMAKRAWWVLTRENVFGGNTDKMWAQYPSTLAEAFTVSNDGRWFGPEMARVRREGRLTTVPFVSAFPVNTFWDIGDNIALWFHQLIGLQDRFIRFNEFQGEPYSAVVAKMQEHGYVWGTHYLPWDAGNRKEGEFQVKSVHDMLWDLGLRNMELVPQIDRVANGNQMLREDMRTYWFDEEHCAEGILHLDGYQKVYNRTLGTWTENELKNGHDHAASALRQKAQVRDIVAQGGHSGQSRPNRRNTGGMAV